MARKQDRLAFAALKRFAKGCGSDLRNLSVNHTRKLVDDDALTAFSNDASQARPKSFPIT